MLSLRRYELYYGLIVMRYLEDEVCHGLEHLFHLQEMAGVHAIVLLKVTEQCRVFMSSRDKRLD